ncbi:MAG TPA: DUF6286 domain-containing protein [Pseudonocardiaceae bacterium]
MTRLPRRTVPAMIVALLVLAACVLVAVCCLQALSGHPPVVSWHQVTDLGRRYHWHDAAVLTVGGVAAGLGLILLVCALLPGRPTVLPLGPVTPDPDTEPDEGIASRGLRQALYRSATAPDGVSGAELSLRHRQVAVRVDTPRAEPAAVQDIRERVTEAVSESIDRLALADRPGVRVRVRTRRQS